MIKVHEAQGPGPSPATRRRSAPEEVTMHQPAIPHIESADPEIADLIHAEARRQFEKIRLIPSENYVSTAVLEASGSVLTNKYSEGYPGRRYYEGQQVIDPIEELAARRAEALFGAEHANVQPYSGSPANLAVYLAFLQPGDTVMGMSLPHGGHLTHGWPVSITGKWFRPVAYEVGRETGRADMDQVRELALHEAATPAFREYAHSIVENARVLAEELSARGFDLVSGGTDNHLILIDLTSKEIGGKPAAEALDRAGITCNYNTVPFDPRKPF